MLFVHFLTGYYPGLPDAQHPNYGHWEQTRYDEAGNLIRAPRGTFPLHDKWEDEERERSIREKIEHERGQEQKRQEEEAERKKHFF